MWDVKKLKQASAEARRVAELLRELVQGHELGNSRLPDFVALTQVLGQPCVPFREHQVKNFTQHILQSLLKRNEKQVIVFENPLYEDVSNYVGVADLSDGSDCRVFLDEEFFSGGFIMSTTTPLFRWLGNFTDYGFMFTDMPLLEDIFDAPALTIYNAHSCEFRIASGGYSLLDSEIRKLDKIWSVPS